MYWKNKFVIGIILLLIISSVSALIFEKNKEIDLTIPCINNNTYCSSSAGCNITIFYPNGTILLDNGIMTNNISFHNYTLNTNFTSVNGDYSSTVICNDGSFNGHKTFTFKITPSGTEPTITQGIFYIVLMIIAVIILMICLFLAWNIDGNNLYDVGGKLISVNLNKYVKYGLWMFSYLTLIFIVFFCWEISKQFLFLDFMSIILKWLFIVLMTMVGPVIITTFVLMLTKWLLDAKLHKLSERGLKARPKKIKW